MLRMSQKRLVNSFLSKYRRFFAPRLTINFNIRLTMSTYFILALTVTVLYFIYYAVIIVRDLYGKKDEPMEEAETYEMPKADNDEEQSIAVTENEHGFSIGEDNYDTEADVLPQDEGQDSNPQKPSLEEALAKVEAGMEETESFMSDPMNDKELYKSMMAHSQVDNNVKVEVVPAKNEL